MSTSSRDTIVTTACAGRTRALVVGAGKIGTDIASLLASAPDYDVTVLDRSERALRTAGGLGVHTVRGDTADSALLGRLSGGNDMVLSAVPFDLTIGVARAAREAGAHYFDLTEDRASARAVAAITRPCATPATARS
ncbi:MAG: saccharopine dehydrogenase NADP-binding domain-containing protein [Pseudonocardiaceae bacterium]